MTIWVLRFVRVDVRVIVGHQLTPPAQVEPKLRRSSCATSRVAAQSALPQRRPCGKGLRIRSPPVAIARGAELASGLGRRGAAPL